MPISSYQVDLKTEIAFNSGLLTPAASRVWVDVSQYVELQRGLTITHGRQDERTQADANQLSLTLDNRDGRFTAGLTTGAYYPNVKLDRPIRVTGTPVDGSAQVEGVFYINEWPTEWSDGTAATAYASISASSRMARLGTVATLPSIIEQAIRTDSPAAYYTMGEPSGSTQANDSSGNSAGQQPPLVVNGNSAAVNFGNSTGPGTDGLTAAGFVTTDGSGNPLDGYLNNSITPGVTFTVELFLATSTVLSANADIALWGEFGLGIDTSGRAYGRAKGVTVSSSVSVADGNVHHLAMTRSGATFFVYLDGVSLGSANPGTAAVGSLVVGEHYTGSVAHLAIFTTVLSLSTLSAHANAGLTGYAGETTSARIARYLGYVGVESAALNAETGQTTVQHVDTTDKQAVELMRLMEVTEGGVLFDERDGTTAFHNRAHRLSTASVFTLDMAQQMVESGYTPKLDRTGLANDITAQDTSGRYTAHVLDAQSRNVDNGVASMNIETASEDDDEPLFQASWALYKYKNPLPRVATLSVDCLAQVGKTPNCAAVLAANVGSKITVSNRPAQDSTSSATFFVEGYTRVYGPESCVTTFNVSPTSPEDNTYIVADVTGRGVIGANPIAL